MARAQILDNKLFLNIRNFQEVIEVKLLHDVHVCVGFVGKKPSTHKKNACSCRKRIFRVTVIECLRLP